MHSSVLLAALLPCAAGLPSNSDAHVNFATNLVAAGEEQTTPKIRNPQLVPALRGCVDNEKLLQFSFKQTDASIFNCKVLQMVGFCDNVVVTTMCRTTCGHPCTKNETDWVDRDDDHSAAAMQEAMKNNPKKIPSNSCAGNLAYTGSKEYFCGSNQAGEGAVPVPNKEGANPFWQFCCQKSCDNQPYGAVVLTKDANVAAINELPDINLDELAEQIKQRVGNQNGQPPAQPPKES